MPGVLLSRTPSSRTQRRWAFDNTFLEDKGQAQQKVQLNDVSVSGTPVFTAGTLRSDAVGSHYYTTPGTNIFTFTRWPILLTQPATDFAASFLITTSWDRQCFLCFGDENSYGSPSFGGTPNSSTYFLKGGVASLVLGELCFSCDDMYGHGGGQGTGYAALTSVGPYFFAYAYRKGHVTWWFQGTQKGTFTIPPLPPKRVGTITHWMHDSRDVVDELHVWIGPVTDAEILSKAFGRF